MTEQSWPNCAQRTAAAIDAEIRGLPVRNTPSVRAVRRKYSRVLKPADPDLVLAIAKALLDDYGHRGVACELVANHPMAFHRIGPKEIEGFGRGMASWGAADTFARTLAGPAWLAGQLPDAVIHRWARSKDRWWRRGALVSTVALNVRSQGGLGDAERTLAVCRMLAADSDDMVIKALSWALRELIPHDPRAVRAFLVEHDAELAARVKREVRNKLTTGLKTPGRRRP